MADSSIAITAGTGTPIDTFTQAGGDHRQAMVIGDASAAYTATVDSSGRITVDAQDPDTVVTGSITATDAVVAAPAGDGTLRSGTPTAASYVSSACPGGDSAWNVQITGLTSGSLYFEISMDSTNGADGSWVAVNARQSGIVNTNLGYVATANGVYRGNTSGAKYFRVRSVGTLTGTPAIVIRISGGIGAVFLNASIPTGSNAIGITDVRGTSLTSVSNNYAAAATGTGTALDVSRQGNVTFVVKNQVAASAFGAGMIVVFEQSDDNTSWYPLMVVRNDNQFAASTHRFEANIANSGFVLEAAAEAVNYVRARVTTGPATNGATIVVQGGSLPFSPIVTAQTQQSFITGGAQGNINVVRTSATTTIANTTALVAALGAGLSIYVTDIVASNSGGSLTVVTLGAGTGFTPVYDIPLAASGGGATISLRTPWKIAANTGLYWANSVASSTVYLTVNYYVGA